MDAAPSPAPSLALPFPAPSGVAPELLRPLRRLGSCPAPPSDVAPEQPASLGLPPDALVTSVEPADPLTSIQGWIDWTPVQLRVWYQHLSSLEVVQAEDEVFESEVLVRLGDGRRLFVKAQAVCESASVFVAVLAPEEAADAVPTPAGSPGASPAA